MTVYKPNYTPRSIRKLRAERQMKQLIIGMVLTTYAILIITLTLNT